MFIKWLAIAALLQAPVVILAATHRNTVEEMDTEEMRNIAGRALLKDILGEVFQKARNRGALHRGGFENRLYLVALSGMLRRLEEGEEVDLGAVSLAIEGLGFHLEDTDGEISVVEN